MTELQARAASLSPLWRRALLVVLVAAGSFAAAKLSDAYAIRPADVSVLWAPSGLMLGLLLLLETGEWPYALAGGCVGTLVACLGFGTPIANAAGGAAVNLVEALLAAVVVRRLSRGAPGVDTLRGVGALALGAAAGVNAVTAAFGGWLIRAAHGSYLDSYFSWWAAHGLGMLVVAPIVLTAASRRADRRRASRTRLVQLGAYFAALATASFLILGAHAGADGVAALDPYAVLPLLLVGALLFGSTAAARSNGVVAAALLWHAAQQRGPFVDFATSHRDEVLDVYVFLLLGSVLSLVIAAMLRERRAAERDASERARHAAAVADVALALTGSASIDGALNQSAGVILTHLHLAGVRIATYGRPPVVAIAAAGAEPPRGAEITTFPLLIDDRAVGALDVTSATPLGDRSLETMASLTRALALGIERHEGESSRRRLTGILDAAPDFVTIGQPGGPPLYINPAARRAFGLAEGDAVPSLFAFRPPEFPSLFRNVILPTIAADGIWRGETEYRTRGGRIVPVSQVSVAHRDASGDLALVSTISRDISAERAAAAALQASEERMRFALTSARIGLWEANIRTDVAYWSESMEAIHGLGPHTFGRTQQAFLEAVHPDDRAMVREVIGRAMRDHRDAELEYRTQWPDGSVHLLQSTAHFTYDDQGAPIRGAGVARDITEQRSLEDQFRQAQKMEAIGQLAGGVAHDFNNLLTAIQGYALLVRDSLDAHDPRRADVEEITHASARAAALTRQLLAFSRKQILSTQVLRVGDVVNGMMPMLRRLLGESIDLESVFRDSAQVRADAGQLEQVLMNLAVNARDAMPEGGRLTIETGELDLDTATGRRHTDLPSGRYVTLVVTDTGHGMDAATRRRIFEPFFTTKPRGQGTGLGLATVHGIVKQSGGHIWVYSEPGHGTTFKVCLPRTDEVETPVVEPEAAAPARGNGTVLLVEDEALVRRFAGMVLKNAGYTVIAAERPSEAIALATSQRDPIDVILTDVIMPEMNGRALTTRLAGIHPEASVVYMSGYTDTAIVHQGVLEPGMRFLQKPFGASALVEKVREAAASSGVTARSA